MNKILFLDFNWVISFNKFWQTLSITHQNTYTRIQKNIFWNQKDLVKKRMTWEITYIDIIKVISKNTGTPIEKLSSVLQKDCRNIDIDRELIEALYENYRLILITDNMDCFNHWVKPILLRSWKFTNIQNSWDDWYLKWEKSWKIFSQLCEKYNTCIGDTILVDDSKINCLIFSSLWWESIHFESKKKFLSLPLFHE
jgi:hypothetical protein